MRRPIIAGNWKMYKTTAEARALVSALVTTLQDEERVEVVVCPPFTALSTVAPLLAGTRIALGAQDVHWEDEGAFTGAVSPRMLVDLGCRYVIIGHSERRAYFAETDETVNRKTRAVLAHGLVPIVCVGESLAQREAGQTRFFVTGQVRAGLAALGEKARTIVIAYEPIWAIGTGHSATGKDAAEVIGLIRETLAEMDGRDTAEAIRSLYGGSVKPENSKEFMTSPGIDGALVGGASLKAESFVPIVRYYA
ncbi:MAG: triose-phosphate isomerase [Firmicutes bacterium]|nr:triose-phosphate isomerase [Bacillota bacterium]